jgi:predicted DNA-binding protein
MPHISLRVTEEEKGWIEGYAKLQGASVSDAIKEAFFEKLEDEYDLKVALEHEKEKAAGNMKYYTLDEVKEMLGFNDDV